MITKSPLHNRFVFLTLVGLFWTGAFCYGFIYEHSFLIANICLFIVLIIALFIHKEIRITFFHLGVFFFVVVYWLALLFAVDIEQAVLEAGRVTSLIPLSVLVTLLSYEQRYQLYKMWAWIGVFLTSWGLLFGMFREQRLESTFGYANTLAIFLLLSSIISIVVYLNEHRRTYLLLLLINLLGLMLTYSRIVWVLTIMVAILLIVMYPEMRRKSSLSKIGMAIMGVLVVFFVWQDGSHIWNRIKSIKIQTSELQTRFDYWKHSWELIQTHWWTGIGGGGWRVLGSDWYYAKHVHNHYLQIALDTGVLGLAIFLGLIVMFYVKTIKKCSTSQGEERNWLKAAILLTSCLLFHAVFDIDFIYPLILWVLICLFAVAYDSDSDWSIKLDFHHIVFISCVSLVPIVFFVWITIGYGYKDAGVRLTEENQWQAAEKRYTSAKKMLPWSHSVIYESAKNAILSGNEHRDLSFYQRAEQELRKAVRLLPEHEVYSFLLKEFEENR